MTSRGPFRPKTFYDSIKISYCPACMCLESRTHLAHTVPNQQFLKGVQNVKVSKEM